MCVGAFVEHQHLFGNESFDSSKAMHDNINNDIDGKTVDVENLVKSENAEETLADKVVMVE